MLATTSTRCTRCSSASGASRACRISTPPPAYRDLPADELVVNARDTHPNARAHAIAAQAILRFLERDVLTRPVASPG